jgi:hypothetical protein
MTQRIQDMQAGKVMKPFFMVLSLWNPHDSPIAFPGAPANSTDMSKLNSSVVPKWKKGGYTEDIFLPTNPPVELPVRRRVAVGLCMQDLAR